jgi:hypothetical protein
MKDLVEVILQQTSLPKIFLMQDIGGPSYFIVYCIQASSNAASFR